MPVVPVVPLKDKPGLTEEQIAEAVCEHLAYEVLGSSRMGDKVREHRRCADCKQKFIGTVFVPPVEIEDEPEDKPGKPPKAVYGHAQVVTYTTERGQYDLVVGELAMVSLQAGALVIQHPQVSVTGITGVRPWVVPEEGEDDADVQR